MRRTEGQFPTPDGLELFCQAWHPYERTRAAVAVVHGYAEHSGRYQRLAHYLVPRGYAVYACDLRGHGRSPGERGYVRRFSDYLLDAGAFLGHVRQSEPGCKTFLLGHSMGGLIAATYAEEPSAELPGLILSSPFLQLKMPVPAWKRLAASILSSIAPSFAMPSAIPIERISHDPEVIAQTRQDPLHFDIATPRWFTETVTAQRRALERAINIRMPVGVFYAGDDYIANPQCTARFCQCLRAEDTSCYRYEGFYHEIFNDVGRETVYIDLARWLGCHL